MMQATARKVKNIVPRQKILFTLTHDLSASSFGLAISDTAKKKQFSMLEDIPKSILSSKKSKIKLRRKPFTTK